MVNAQISSYPKMLRYRPFRQYLLGYFLVTIGQQMQSVAIGWEIYERTRSEWALGLVNLAQVVPVVALALFTGHILDRYNRKFILLLSQLGYTLMALGLAIISYHQWPVKYMYLCLLFGGVGRAFFAPARIALLPQLLPPGNIAKALNFSSGAWQFATALGPALGGFLLATSHHPYWVYAIGVTNAIIFMGLVSSVPIQQGKPQDSSIRSKSILAGIRYIFRTKLLLSVMVLDLFAVLLGGATTLLPVYAIKILHVGPTGLGWLRAAPSFGAILAAGAIAYFPAVQKAGRTLIFAVVGFGLVTIVFGLSKFFWLSFSMLILLGAFDNVSVVIRSTLEQLKTPDEMRGRVSAMSRLSIDLSNELGGFESGAVANLVGPIACVVGGGIGTMMVVGLISWWWPQLWKLGKLEDTSQG